MKTSASLFLLNSCNNLCVMCTCMPNSLKFKLDLEKTEDLLSQLPQDTSKVTVSGGEPTLMKDIFKILRMIRKNLPTAELCMLSNGRMFYYPEFTRKFVETGVDSVAIPLHGHNAKLHDGITRAPGSFNQTVQGIKNLLQYRDKVRVDIRIVIHRLNYKQVPKICEFIAKEFRGIFRVVLFPIDIVGAANINRKKIIVKITAITPYVQKGLGALEREGFECQLFHIPFCVIDKKYWDKVAGMSVGEAKVTFKPCDGCIMRESCPGIWKTYAFRIGTDEFKPIKPIHLTKSNI